MFEYLRGKLVHLYPTYLVIECQGVGYKVLVPNPFSFQEQVNHEITLYVEQVVREDAHNLYGFRDLNEKTLFLRLNKVSGIGPKSALSILAADDHQGLVQAIDSGDSMYLTKFPGVGKKTAQQMVLDLKGDLSQVVMVDKPDQAKTVTSSQVMEEVKLALEGLGYSAREVSRVEKELKQVGIGSTQEGLSLAFKLLLKK